MGADEKKAMIAVLSLPSSSLPEDGKEFDEDHVADYFGGDVAMADLFLAVLRFDGAPSGAQIADLARKHFHGDFDTARSFCALAAETKVRVREQEERNAHEEIELAEDVGPGHLRQRDAPRAGRPQHAACDPGPRGADVVEGDRRPHPSPTRAGR
jgi:hypothetical protein